MKIQLSKLSEDKDVLTFQINGTVPSYVNALRRLIISEVPTMAIEDVEIRKNSSILYDDVLAHR